MKKNIYKALSVVCALAFLGAAAHVINSEIEYKESESAYEDMANVLVSNRWSNAYLSNQSTTAEDGTEQAPVDIDFAKLKEMNASAVGWLYCAGTQINYPVVQSSDNSYYLTHLADNQTNSSGSIFMDALNAPDLTDANTVIYGHNMKNGSMFAVIEMFKEQDFINAHPVMYYMTEDKSYKIELFAAYPAEADAETYTIFFDSEDTYKGYLKRAWDQSEVRTDVEVTPNDNIVTLVSCTGRNNGQRNVVQGKVTELN